MSNTQSKAKRLAEARRELLDLSCRNRLISTARTSSRSTRLEIVDELSEQIFQILVQSEKEMAFLPAEEQENDDDLLAPRDMIHVTDADSSQAMAIEEVRQGRNLVIQGPPGTSHGPAGHGG